MTTADTSGSVILDDGKSKLGNQPARVRRVATLDLGAVPIHSGVTAADRTFTIETEIDADQKTAVEYILAAAEQVTVSCSEGCFLAVIDSIDTSTPTLKMKILILEKVSE